MKFLCLPCDRVMEFAERALPGDGTLAAVFSCDGCGNEIAMLTNPMETRLVSSLGIKVGGREVPAQPLELVRSSLAQGRDDAFDDDPADNEAGEPRAGPAAGPGMTEPTPADSSAGDGDVRPDASRPAVPAGPIWSDAAVRRLAQVPSFVRGMVKRIYTDYARENGIAEITPAVMDRARTDLGLEGM